MIIYDFHFVKECTKQISVEILKKMNKIEKYMHTHRLTFKKLTLVNVIENPNLTDIVY